MMGKVNCLICKKRSVQIETEDGRILCRQCMNEEIFHLLKNGKTLKEFGVFDKTGCIHWFQVHFEHNYERGQDEWFTTEENGNFFFLVADTGCARPQLLMLQKLVKKTIQGVLLQRTVKNNLLSKTGTIQIQNQWGEEIKCVVDGHEFTPEQLIYMLAEDGSCNVQYQIKDLSDGLLRNDEILVPVQLTGDIIIKKAEQIMDEYADANGWVRSCRQEDFVFAFSKVCNMLEMYYAAGRKSDTRHAAQKIVEKLEQIQLEPLGAIESLQEGYPCEVVEMVMQSAHML